MANEPAIPDRDARMLRVFDAHTSNVPIAEIARNEGIARNTVYADIRRAAKLSTTQNKAEIISATNLAKLDIIERQADEKFAKASPRC